MTSVSGLLQPKQALMIAYDLKTQGHDYTTFYQVLQQQGLWWHYLSSCWLVVTSSTPDQVYRALVPHFTQQDWILIMPIKKPAFGWLPKDAWDWINTNVPFQ